MTSGFLQKPSNGKALKQDIELKLTPLVSAAPSLRKITSSIKPPTEAYALNRTQSTGGIATKVSLELKKKYLLGETIGGGSGNIQKSGSASTLDTKLKSFCSNISDCQKLLKPSTEGSPSMQTFCKKLDENTSPILSPSTFSTPTIVTETKKNEENQNKNLPPPDLINDTVTETKENKDEPVFVNETEGRPRSPLHETSLIVPEIDWKKVSQCAESLSSSSSSSSSSDEQIKSPNVSQKNIPTVEVCEAEDYQEIEENDVSQTNDFIKSISSDKKQLNQPKTLPGLKTDFSNDSMKRKLKESGYQKLTSQDDRSSGCSTPISMGDDITNVFTETELSDWARDGCVSDDLEGVGFDLNAEEEQKQKLPNLHTIGHICGKKEDSKTPMVEPLSANFDSIEFMDTCTESNSEEGVVNSITYNILNNEDIAEDSLNPILNNIIEAQNTVITESKMKNSGYCIIASDNNNFGGEVVNLKPADIEHLKQNQHLCERDEDSLLVVETTTEENTCSDSTVKNITEIPKDSSTALNTKQRLEGKLSQLKKEKDDILLQVQIEREIEKMKDEKVEVKDIRNVEFDEHCQRLQSKIDFGNVKDSIDIRKSRRKSKDSPQKPELIQEEKQGSELNLLQDITLNLSPTIKTPDQIYKKEIIEKERNVNQRLVQEMVMSKMRAENKALERKIRSRPTTNFSNKPFQLSKSATADISKININNLNTPIKRIADDVSGNFVLKEKEPIVGMSTLQKSQTSPNVPGDNRTTYNIDVTPIAPPRTRDLKNTTEKLKSEARARAKMLSNEELGISPEDKILRLREKTRRYERSASSENSEFQLYPKALSSEMPISSNEFRKQRPISEYLPKTNENRKSFVPVGNKSENKKMCRSESNLFQMSNVKEKTKDDSPKKGIKFTKIMDLFSKKSPKGLFSKISPKSKDVSKVIFLVY